MFEKEKGSRSFERFYEVLNVSKPFSLRFSKKRTTIYIYIVHNFENNNFTTNCGDSDSDSYFRVCKKEISTICFFFRSLCSYLSRYRKYFVSGVLSESLCDSGGECRERKVAGVLRVIKSHHCTDKPKGWKLNRNR